jgi:hypothetical protein
MVQVDPWLKADVDCAVSFGKNAGAIGFPQLLFQDVVTSEWLRLETSQNILILDRVAESLSQ